MWTIKLLVTAIVLAVAAFLVDRLRKRLQWAAEVDKIPGPKCNYPLVNNGDLLWKNGMPFSESGWLALKEQCFAHYGDGLCRVWLGHKPFVLLFSPENVEKLLSNTVHLDKAEEYDFIKPWLRNGLVVASGSKWKARRRLLTPAFHFKILSDFLPVINDHSKTFVEKLAEERGDAVDIRNLITAATLDIICETAMGYQLDALADSEQPYIKALLEFCNLFIQRHWRFFFWPDCIWGLTKPGRKLANNIETMHQFTRDVIEKRKEQLQSEQLVNNNVSGGTGKRRLAFLDLLLEHYARHEIDMDGIQEEVDTFMFAGHDTTAASLTFVLLCIGSEPEVQDRIHEEIDNVFGEDTKRSITIEDLKQMTFLEATIKEVWRLYPPITMTARKLREPLELDKYTIPSGCSVFVMTDVLAQNAEIFPEPEKFNPDRFLLENASVRNPYAYLPFSAGPRSCIGQRFAMMEVKLMTADILRHFTIKSERSHRDITKVVDIVLRAKDPVMVRFSPRHTTCITP